VDAEALAAELRACGTEVEVVPVSIAPVNHRAPR
jgi:hypothetical protein